MKRRVQLQQRSATNDDVGGQSVAWETVATLWASIVALGGRELLSAQAVQSEVTHSVTVRYRAEFSSPKTAAAMRLVYGARIFNISSVENVDEQNKVVVLTCFEGLNDG